MALDDRITMAQLVAVSISLVKGYRFHSCGRCEAFGCQNPSEFSIIFIVCFIVPFQFDSVND